MATLFEQRLLDCFQLVSHHSQLSLLLSQLNFLMISNRDFTNLDIFTAAESKDLLMPLCQFWSFGRKEYFLYICSQNSSHDALYTESHKIFKFLVLPMNVKK